MTEQRHGLAHLCGSVPLEDAEAVFRTVSETVGPYLATLPDGETGERTRWIGWQAPQFLHNPSLEVVSEVGEGYRPPRVRLRADTEPTTIRFGRIGYADVARESWRVFCRLRDEGVIPDACRFQVCLPTPLAPIGSYVAEGQADLEPAYEAALMGELAEISAMVPHDCLAIQWDVVEEFAILEGVHSAWFEDMEEEIARRLLRIGGFVPEEVALGYHLCYGDPRGGRFAEPADAGRLVAIANRLGDLTRSLDWIHLPVPQDRDDHAYFAPLASLRRRRETRLYLGLLHVDDGLDGAKRRIDAAKVAGEFGVAAECGLGRHPTEQVPDLLRLHVEAVDLIR